MHSIYILKTEFFDGSFQVEGRRADGSLVFGFRSLDFWGWQEKARSYSQGLGLPVFLASGQTLADGQVITKGAA